MHIEELLADLKAQQAMVRDSSPGKVTGPGWDQCAFSVCGPTQEQVLQERSAPDATVEGELVFEEPETDLKENFEESLDILEKTLYFLETLIALPVKTIPGKLRADLRDKHLDIWEFITDYRELQGEEETEESIATGGVQTKEEFIKQLEAEDEGIIS